jgi:hypothetical protein
MSSVFIEWHFLYITYNDYTVIIKAFLKEKVAFLPQQMHFPYSNNFFPMKSRSGF